MKSLILLFLYRTRNIYDMRVFMHYIAMIDRLSPPSLPTEEGAQSCELETLSLNDEY